MLLKPTSFMRRSLLAAALSAPAAAMVSAPVHAQELVSGVYQGTWHDGRNLVERLVVYPSYLTIVRIAGGDHQGGPPVTYASQGPSVYQSDRGHQIIVTGPESFTWVNSGGGNRVNYVRIQ